jgi:hypothetical protein
MKTIRLILSTAIFFSHFIGITPQVFAGGDNSPQENPLYVDPATRDFSNNPALLERIFATPHGYFRFINIPFSEEICRRFSKAVSGRPSFNLHGDAHIEQYAVTDLGRGLTDYDDSSTGPAIIDVMRFGVSLNLACREREWEDQAEAIFDQFLNGYRAALNTPDTLAPEPVVVKRIRAGFKVDRQGYFQWVASITEAMPGGERDSLLAAIKPYIETKLLEDPNKTADYFRIIGVGYLRMGIGSALDMKYLARIRGASENPLDDIVLEFKEVRDLRGIDCINSGQPLDPFRILLGQTRIAYQPFKHLGYFRFRGKNFWVHSWVDNYKEAEIGETFQSPQELAEVAFDVGVQLGLGHVKHIAAPLDLQIRREQLLLLDQYQAEIKQAVAQLDEQTVAAWETFCGKVKEK